MKAQPLSLLTAEFSFHTRSVWAFAASMNPTLSYLHYQLTYNLREFTPPHVVKEPVLMCLHE